MAQSTAYCRAANDAEPDQPGTSLENTKLQTDKEKLESYCLEYEEDSRCASVEIDQEAEIAPEKTGDGQ